MSGVRQIATTLQWPIATGSGDLLLQMPGLHDAGLHDRQIDRRDQCCHQGNDIQGENCRAGNRRFWAIGPDFHRKTEDSPDLGVAPGATLG